VTQPDISAAFEGDNAITFGSVWSRDITLNQDGVPLVLTGNVMRAQMRIASSAGSTATLIASTVGTDQGTLVAALSVLLPGAAGLIRVSQSTEECRRMSGVVGNVGKTFFIELEGVLAGETGKFGAGTMSFLPETTVTEPDPS